MDKKELETYKETIRSLMPSLAKFNWKLSSKKDSEFSGEPRYLLLRDINSLNNVSVDGVYMNSICVYPSFISLTLENHIVILEKSNSKVKISLANIVSDKEYIEIVDKKEVSTILRKYN